MKFLIKTIYVMLLITYSASISSMTTLQRLKTIRTIPLQRPYTAEPTISTQPIAQTPQPLIHKPLYPSQQQPNTFYNRIVSFWNWLFKTPKAQTVPQKSMNTQDNEQLLTPISETVKAPKLFPTISDDQAFESALDIIKKKLKKYIEKYRIKLDGIVCLPPGKEILFLLEAESLTEMENLLKNKKEQIFQAFGLSADELKIMQDEIDAGIRGLSEIYKTSSTEIHHDTKNLPSETLEETKKLLKEVGIEPSNIGIHMKRNADPNSGSCSALYIKRPGFTQIGAYLEFAKDLNPALRPFIIAHEIGHLLRFHTMQLYALNNCLQKKFKNKTETTDILNNRLNLQALFEIEADIYVAMRFPNIAKTIYTTLIQHTSFKDLPFMKASPIYISIYNRLHLHKKIIDLHTKEQQKNKGSTPNSIRE
jgi:hypothetical protein